MAKIIKRGTNKKVTKTVTYNVYEIKCSRCGCVFEAEEGEFHEECGLSTIWCPQCSWLLDSYRWEYCKKKTRTKRIKEYS